MKNFVDLTIDVAKDENLAKECMDKLNESDPSQLSAWFKSKDYNIDENECQKLVDNKDKFGQSNEGVY